MSNLWSCNTPERFWRCQPNPSAQQWAAAIQKAIPTLGLPTQPNDIDDVLAATLGEVQFGCDHWQMSRPKRLYYMVKPVLPRTFTCWLRRLYSTSSRSTFTPGWPIENRYTAFMGEVLRQLLLEMEKQAVQYRALWPDGAQFALVLTHDVETAEGKSFVRAVADLEEILGFRSSFNFVPERYPVDDDLIEELNARGFEVGVHGLKHDGKLFSSYHEFLRRAEKINAYARQWGAVGFRAPYTQRQPEWMQALDIDYDLSFFDTDPFEPIPGGTMSIWPFFLGHFVELPYTLVQDNTLTNVLGETTPKLWIEKVEFIRRSFGMALINTHPDYLKSEHTGRVYCQFLEKMAAMKNYWHALPRDVARWWRRRYEAPLDSCLPLGTATLVNDGVVFS
jgi:hypothetical protein